MTSLLAQTVPTPDGPFSIIENPQGEVVASGWTDDVADLARRARIVLTDAPAYVGRVAPAGARIETPLGEARSASAVAAYYDGDLAAIDEVTVAHTGTALQLAVWAALRTISPGTAWTYSELAAAIAQPRAIRAAASACAKNAVALFVPCHRVIATSGSLAGFGWGLPIKASLLARERVLPRT